MAARHVSRERGHSDRPSELASGRSRLARLTRGVRSAWPPDLARLFRQGSLCRILLTAAVGPVGACDRSGVGALPPAARAVGSGGAAAHGLAQARAAVSSERRGLPLLERADAPALHADTDTLVRVGAGSGHGAQVHADVALAGSLLDRRPVLLRERPHEAALRRGPAPLRDHPPPVMRRLRAAVRRSWRVSRRT